MSSESHLASLEEKHHALEAELSSLMSSPRPQEELVAELKRRKLKLKDRMEQFRATMH